MSTTSPDRAFATARSTLLSIVGLIVAFLLSMVAVSVFVVTSSIAVFSDTTASSGNSFTVATIDLVDDDLAGALFSVAGIVPGQSITDCIQVTYQGSATDPAAVKVYSGGYTDSGDLDTFLNLTIEEGDGGGFGDCTGFTPTNSIESGGTLSDFDTTHTDYATGAGAWDPSGTPESKTYRVTVELDAAAPNSEQGESVTAMTITWEVQS